MPFPTVQIRLHIGFDQIKEVAPSIKNMHSAQEHPEVVAKYLAEEVAEGCAVGPFPLGMAHTAAWHISCFRVIPKHHTQGKWLLIVDLSFPLGASINDGIDPSLCSLIYTKVERDGKHHCAVGSQNRTGESRCQSSI